MPTQETKVLDSIITSRRAILMGGGAAAVAGLLPLAARAASTVSTYSDADILNFALNLEYLEANFYYLAAFGCTIASPNAAALAANGSATFTLSGVGTAGTVVAPTVTKVPFAIPAVAAYAVETAVEEGKHVLFLRNALGAAAVAQPALDLNTTSTGTGAFDKLAIAAGIAATFNPYASDANFLAGAYIFEDVGVTAYSGAAPLLSTATQPSGNLQAAASILAVEAYHAGMIRSTINAVDTTGSLYIPITQKVSALRATLSKAAVGSGTYPSGTYGDDVPLTYPGLAVSLQGTAATGTTTADADPTNVIAFARTTTQVLNIVTGGGATTAGTKATGVFFPSGLNGLFS